MGDKMSDKHKAAIAFLAIQAISSYELPQKSPKALYADKPHYCTTVIGIDNSLFITMAKL